MGLLMILNKNAFEESLKTLINAVESEKFTKKKSPVVHACLKTLFDCLQIHNFMWDSNNALDLLRQEVRSLLMRQLRDADFSIRLLATEGFSRILVCEKIQNSWEFISRLILLHFEKIPNTKLDNEQNKEFHKKIKKIIEQFFSHYPRLDHSNCVELFEATISSIFYLLRGNSKKELDLSWHSTNTFYLFGTLCDYLKYRTNKQYAIFDQKESGISFHLYFFKFFSFLILSDKTTEEEKQIFAPFLANCL